MELRFDINIIKDAIKELDDNEISNNREFYINEVIKRFNLCNENYISEFDNYLNSLIDNNDDIDIRSINKLVKLSSKLSSNMYNDCIKLLKRLCIEE